MSNEVAITENTITDARATVSGGQVHRASITVYTQGAKVIDQRVRVSCGAVRVRGARRQNIVVAPMTSAITCARCAR